MFSVSHQMHCVSLRSDKCVFNVNVNLFPSFIEHLKKHLKPALFTSMFTTSVLFFPALCWHIAAFLCAFIATDGSISGTA